MAEAFDIAVVVARFREDIGWLGSAVRALRGANRSATVSVHVYDKGGSDPVETRRAVIASAGDPEWLRVRVERLENRRREGGTYVHHLLAMGVEGSGVPSPGDLDVVLFLQGRVDDHLHIYGARSEGELAAAFVADARARGVSCSFAANYGECEDLRVAEWPAGNPVSRSPLTFRQWFETRTDAFLPPGTVGHRWWPAALFAATGAVAKSVPRDRLMLLWEDLDRDCDTEELHFLERSWMHVMMPRVDA
jgi:hypothetical protein